MSTSHDPARLAADDRAGGPEPILVDVVQAAAMIGCGRATFYKLLERGEITAKKLGRRTLIPVAALRDYVSSLPDMQPTPPS